MFSSHCLTQTLCCICSKERLPQHKCAFKGFQCHQLTTSHLSHTIGIRMHSKSMFRSFQVQKQSFHGWKRSYKWGSVGVCVYWVEWLKSASCALHLSHMITGNPSPSVPFTLAVPEDPLPWVLWPEGGTHHFLSPIIRCIQRCQPTHIPVSLHLQFPYIATVWLSHTSPHTWIHFLHVHNSLTSNGWWIEKILRAPANQWRSHPWSILRNHCFWSFTDFNDRFLELWLICRFVC